MPGTTGPSPLCSVCTCVWVTLNGVVTFTSGAVVSVDPVTATLPVVPDSVQSGVPPFGGAAVGHEPAAAAVPEAASVRTVAATEAASVAEYTREKVTAVTLQPLLPPFTRCPGRSPETPDGFAQRELAALAGPIFAVASRWAGRRHTRAKGHNRDTPKIRTARLSQCRARHRDGAQRRPYYHHGRSTRRYLVAAEPTMTSQAESDDFLALTRDGYDRTAAMYAERFHHRLHDKPVDQAVLSAFAGLVAKGHNKLVIDVGCGTGATTALLADSGVDVWGIDLSPNMIAQARRLSPGLKFGVGSMTSLEVPDSSVGGVCAWYSIIHVPARHLAGVLGEFHRVLVPGGLVLLAFQVGDESRLLTNAFAQDIHLTFIRRQPSAVETVLSDKGFGVYSALVRQPDDDGVESTPQAFLIARKL